MKMLVKLIDEDVKEVETEYPTSENGTIVQWVDGNDLIGVPLWRIEWVKVLGVIE